MAKRAHGNDEIWEAELMLAYHLRRVEKARRRLAVLREKEEHESLLQRLTEYKKLTLRADEYRLIDELHIDFGLRNRGLLVVRLPERQPGQSEGDSDTLVMRTPAMVELRVLSAEQSARYWLGPYDVLVPREQPEVLGKHGDGSWWSSGGDEYCTDEAEDRGALCEDAWKQLYAAYSPADGLWYCSKTAYLVCQSKK